MSARVTIAVVSYETRELLDRCLTSLRPAHEQGLASVWVVDNASTDGSAAMVRAAHGWAELVASEHNLGFGPAVNLVAARTQSEFIAAANADVELRPGALGSMLRCAERHRRAGAVAPRLVTPAGATQHSVHAFPGPGLALAMSSGLLQIASPLARAWRIEGSWDPDEGTEVGWAHGAFLLCRRAAFDEAGGFDPDQWMYAEDIDLCWRLAAAGWRVRYEPRASVLHHGSAATSAAFGAERLVRHLAAAHVWQRRRRGRAAAWTALVANLLGAGVRWALALPLSPLSAAARHRRQAYGVWTRAHLRAARGADALVAAPRESGAGSP